MEKQILLTSSVEVWHMMVDDMERQVLLTSSLED
jgi:hypothetical protein